jgi:uncharacterized membrane protein YtjA (UPF0391 family)
LRLWFRAGTFARIGHFLGARQRNAPMLRWAFIFLILGLVAAALGFTNIAGASIDIAKVLFFVFIAIFAVMAILGLTVARKASGG